MKNLVIVGGVAGGMSCAARARRLSEDAHIIVLEKGPYVSFANCGLPYFVGGEIENEASLLLQTPESLKASLNLDVRTGHEVIGLKPEEKTVVVSTPTGIIDLPYDTLVLSPGGEAIAPPITGLDSARVMTLRTVDDAREIRERVTSEVSSAVVLGAGFIGLEAAEALNHRGITTHIVELADHILPPLEVEMSNLVTSHLRDLGITIHTGVAATTITESGDSGVVTLSDGRTIDADLIILSAGVRPTTSVFTDAGIDHERGAIRVDSHGRTNLRDIYAVGDAVLSTHGVTGAETVVALAGPANRAGRLVADHIFTPETAREIPEPIGTAIVRAGALTAAMTGANRGALDRSGIAYTTLHLHPANHAGYFPGSSPIHLLVHIGTNGDILGAQGVGRDGVDKRIDVLATSIAAGLKVDDLIDLDLSYSPPYGSAKDPVNMVGMVGSNVLSGALKLIEPKELDSLDHSSVVLDVRSVAEYESGHLPGAINIPHTELRGRLAELDDKAEGRELIVMCAAGVRSWIGYRIVTAAGHTARMLSGGMTSIRTWYGEQIDSVLEVNHD